MGGNHSKVEELHSRQCKCLDFRSQWLKVSVGYLAQSKFMCCYLYFIVAHSEAALQTVRFPLQHAFRAELVDIEIEQ